MKKSRTFYIESLGCAKNQVDSEIIVKNLIKAGWTLSDDPEGADLLLVNTCGFIQPAKEESIDTALRFKAVYGDKKVLVTGCLSERYKDELPEGLKEVDGFFGNRSLSRIVEASEMVLDGKRVRMFPESNFYEPDYYRRDNLLSLPGSAYVKISEGCDNRCAFCAIPIIRGRLKSRSIESVIDEIKYLLAHGIFEINLIAQDLGSFGSDRGAQELDKLFREIASLKEEFWLRPLYFYPDKFDAGILSVIKSDERIIPYFDLPFQHASRKVLASMGRRGNREKYLELIEKIRMTLPDAVIRSTFLVGFPGETDDDFNTLLEFQRKAEIDWLGVFTYSREEGTGAFSLKHHVSKKTAGNRKAAVENAQTAITEKRLKKYIGMNMRILIEEKIRNENLYIGRSFMQAPEVDGAVVVETMRDLSPGRVVDARITGSAGFDLEAAL
ncbi:MAG: 30S ribosomal protein S12 methylthiotransferase RimO [Spirochaetes bacterium]|nr:30S ribosomal protein S12 methylthiotransferase RimO [Spirochaetota bacterium]